MEEKTLSGSCSNLRNSLYGNGVGKIGDRIHCSVAIVDEVQSYLNATCLGKQRLVSFFDIRSYAVIVLS